MNDEILAGGILANELLKGPVLFVEAVGLPDLKSGIHNCTSECFPHPR
jgi:hypothetical protein